MDDKLISFEIYETIGVGRGPTGLEPIFTAIEAMMTSEQAKKIVEEILLNFSSRKGIGDALDECDNDIVEEIKAELEEIIMSNSNV